MKCFIIISLLPITVFSQILLPGKTLVAKDTLFYKSFNLEIAQRTHIKILDNKIKNCEFNTLRLKEINDSIRTISNAYIIQSEKQDQYLQNELNNQRNTIEKLQVNYNNATKKYYAIDSLHNLQVKKMSADIKLLTRKNFILKIGTSTTLLTLLFVLLKK